MATMNTLTCGNPVHAIHRVERVNFEKNKITAALIITAIRNLNIRNFTNNLTLNLFIIE